MNLSNKIYPITYSAGTFGSSLGWFISLHEGFYPVSPTIEYDQYGNIARQLEGILRIPHTIETINESLKPFPRNKKIACSFESWKRIPNCNIFLDHRTFPEHLYEYIGKEVFPIIVENNSNRAQDMIRKRVGLDAANSKISKRMMNERQSKIDDGSLERKINTNVLQKCKQKFIDSGFINGKDFFVVDTLELYVDHNQSLYSDLCNFLNTTPRHDWLHTMESLYVLGDLERLLNE